MSFSLSRSARSYNMFMGTWNVHDILGFNTRLVHLSISIAAAHVETLTLIRHRTLFIAQIIHNIIFVYSVVYVYVHVVVI